MNNEQQIYEDIAASLIACDVVDSIDDIYFAPSAAEMVTAQDTEIPSVWVLTHQGSDTKQNAAFSETSMEMSIIVFYRYPESTIFESLAAQMIDSNVCYNLRKSIWNYQKGQQLGTFTGDTWIDGDVIFKTDKSRLNTVISSSVAFNIKYEVNYG